jgi:uncharacterized protein YciW
MTRTIIPSTNKSEISRLLTAAVVNEKFQRLLLCDPARALAAGYNGEHFRLSHADRELVLNIRASSIQDFARKLIERPAIKPVNRAIPVMIDSRVAIAAGMD